MDKNKDIINNAIFEKVQNALFWTPLARANINLIIAKNLFIFSAFLYFFSLLMTVGGFFPEISSPVTFFLYPIFTFSLLALTYSIIAYGITVYFEKLLFLRFGILIVLILLYIYILSIHLWAYQFILSFLWKN